MNTFDHSRKSDIFGTPTNGEQSRGRPSFNDITSSADNVRVNPDVKAAYHKRSVAELHLM